HGLVYARLVRAFGEESARQYGQANERAIDAIAELVDRGNIECAMERKSAYLYANSHGAVELVKQEASVASRLGLPAHLTADIPAPVPATLALRFDNQAQFNPVRYLAGLANLVAVDARIFEMTRVEEVRKLANGKRYRVLAEGGHGVDAQDVIIATHLPIVADGMFFARAYPFSHPLIAAGLD